MHKGCAKIRDEMTKDDRDYGELIEPVFRDGDEVHELVADFMDVVKKLDDVEKIKRAIPRFPLNPIHNQVTIQAAPPVRERLLLSHGGVSVVFTSSPRWFDLSTVFCFVLCMVTAHEFRSCHGSICDAPVRAAFAIRAHVSRHKRTHLWSHRLEQVACSATCV